MLPGYSGISRYSNARFKCNRTLLDRYDYTNKGGVIHNNLGDFVREIETENTTLFIDTQDRNPLKTPNPFSFEVRFDNRYNSGEDMRIDRVYQNIEQFTVRQVIVPKSVVITYDEEATTNPLCLSELDDENMMNNRNILLDGPDMDCCNVNSTNRTRVKNNTYILQPIVPIGRSQQMWEPLNPTKIFSQSKLGSLGGLTSFKILDDNGKILQFREENGTPINNIDEYINNIKAKTDPSLHESIEQFRDSTQVAIVIEIGTVTPRQTTTPFS